MIKTKTYYTDYVNHAIRFYLSTPGGIDFCKRNYTDASVNNWLAVQLVFRKMDEKDIDMVKAVFKCGHYLPKAVDEYCKQNGLGTEEEKDKVWMVLSKVNAKIARVRGLV